MDSKEWAYVDNSTKDVHTQKSGSNDEQEFATIIRTSCDEAKNSKDVFGEYAIYAAQHKMNSAGGFIHQSQPEETPLSKKLYEIIKVFNELVKFTTNAGMLASHINKLFLS